MKRAFLDVNHACAGLLLRLGLDPTPRGEVQILRFPCGKKRPEGPPCRAVASREGGKVVRIKKTDLSRAKRNSSLVTGH